MINEISTSQGESRIIVNGLFFYKGQYGAEAIDAFLKDFLRGEETFCDCRGGYWARIECPENRTVYFSDNSGLRRYYINRENKEFKTTFSDAFKCGGLPNYDAISQFLYFGCVYDYETVASSIVISNPNSYYIVDGNGIEEKSKNLSDMRMIEEEDASFEELMKLACRAAAATFDKFACTITGGVDSRSVLSHVLHNNLTPILDITGAENHIDVEIAREISKLVGLKLLIVSDDIEENETDWLSDAIKASHEGVTGVCGTYRLLKKANVLQKLGIPLEFGGLAGELYKNSFINQDYPFYFGRTNWRRFCRMKVMTYNFPKSLCGKNISEQMNCMENYIVNRLSKNHEDNNKANAYLSAGYEILQARSAGVNTMNSQRYIGYSPLMERAMASYGFHRNPYALEMQSFQRNQVSRFCPELKGIRTDRGLTCDNSKIAREYFKSMAYLLHVAAGRIFKRDSVVNRIDACFEKGLHSPQFYEAFQCCKELEILSTEVTPDILPLWIADRVFTIGSIFRN